jgi:type I restriction enzyme, S subunit
VKHPEGWKIVRLKRLATKFGSGVTPRGGASVYQRTGIPFLRSQNIHFDGLRLAGVAHISGSIHQSLSGTHVHAHDVLLNITGASIGRVCAIPENFTEANVNQHVCIIRPRSECILPSFLAAYLSTRFAQREIHSEQNGASREGLTLQSIRSFIVLLPDLNEQALILKAVGEETRQIVAATQTIEREIALLQDFRTRLIADVVTGKLDVRSAAASLPDEVEIEPIATLDDGEDLAEEAEDAGIEEAAA